MKAKKSLGQNFLTSIPARLAIVKAGEVTPEDIILEIGPGKGFLTRALLDTGAHVTALEKDAELIPVLEETFAKEIAQKKLTLIEGDALTFKGEDAKLNSGRWKLVANIPYYITGAIFERYLSSRNQPNTMVVLIQKEVAERICSKDGKESILSLSVKAYGDPKLVYRVSKGSFNPIPNVDSAVLQIKHISRKHFADKKHEDNFFRVVRAGFAHKRKFLLSNLKESIPHIYWAGVFKSLDVDEKIRAENVPLGIWLSLAQKA